MKDHIPRLQDRWRRWHLNPHSAAQAPSGSFNSFYVFSLGVKKCYFPPWDKIPFIIVSRPKLDQLTSHQWESSKSFVWYPRSLQNCVLLLHPQYFGQEQKGWGGRKPHTPHKHLQQQRASDTLSCWLRVTAVGPPAKQSPHGRLAFAVPVPLSAPPDHTRATRLIPHRRGMTHTWSWHSLPKAQRPLRFNPPCVRRIPRRGTGAGGSEEEEGAARSGGELAAVRRHGSSAFPRPRVPNTAN